MLWPNHLRRPTQFVVPLAVPNRPKGSTNSPGPSRSSLRCRCPNTNGPQCSVGSMGGRVRSSPMPPPYPQLASYTNLGSSENLHLENCMGSRGAAARPDSSESRRGRNTLFRKGAAPEPVAVKPRACVQTNLAVLAFWPGHAPAAIASWRLWPEHAVTFGTLARLAAECRVLAERVAAEGPAIKIPRATRANSARRLSRDAAICPRRPTILG